MNRRNNLDNSIQYFYNDVFRYSPEKVGVHYRLEARECTECELLQDEWRKFVSQTCPGLRSAHAVVATPLGREAFSLWYVAFHPSLDMSGLIKF